MYYSENYRKKMVEKMKNDKEFMEYAQKNHVEDLEIRKRVKGIAGQTYESFDDYLLANIINLEEDYSLIKFLTTAKQEEIADVCGKALKSLGID